MPNTTRMLSIDPGEVHVGTAIWYGADCTMVREYSPWDFFAILENWLKEKKFDLVVIEEYRLYPWKSAEQGFSQIKTVEVIGIIRFLISRWGEGIPMVEQPALIKKPTEGHMRSKGLKYRSVTEKAGGHCKDAESHGQYYLMYGHKAPATAGTFQGSKGVKI